MKPTHEVQYTARERHRRDRRARHQADKALTATIAALGAGDRDAIEDGLEEDVLLKPKGAEK